MFVLCVRSGLWIWIHQYSAILPRWVWEEEAIVFQLGTFSSSLVSASGASFSVTLNIVPPLERHVFVTKTLHAILLDCGTRNCLCVVCLTLCQWQWTRNVMFLSSCLTFITVLSLTDCMEPTMWPAAVLINMTSACLVRLSVLWPDQVQHEPRLWPQHFVHHYDSVT